MPTSSSSSSSVEPPPITSGLILWFTAETCVTKGSDDRVSQWQDALTGFLSASQPTAAAKPLWVADAFPGHPGIRFSGTQSLFIQTSDMGQNNFTIIILGRATAQRLTGGTTHAGQRFLICQNFTEGFPAVSVGTNGFGIYEFGASPALRAEAETDASVLCPLSIRYVNRAPAGYLNGNLAAQGAPTSGILCSIPHSIGGDEAGNGFVGDIAEILIYDGTLTEQNRLVVESWLQAKYDCYSGSSDSSESSESSDGGGGGGSSDSSESSDSSSSESSESSSSESSESSDSSSSESSDSSNSSDSLSLYFEDDPVYVDWNDTSYDANDNLVTNHSPINWSISAQESTINDTGVVTFGTIGEETTVSASGSPYDSMTLSIIKIRIERDFNDITDTEIEVWVGETISLTAQIQPSIADCIWTIPGTIRADFTMTAQKAEDIEVKEDDLKKPSVSFFWTRRGPFDGTFTVKYTATLPTGESISAQVIFKVKEPAASFTATMSKVTLQTSPQNPDIARLGLFDIGVAGIVFTATGDSQNDGQYGWVQIASLLIRWVTRDGIPGEWSDDNGYDAGDSEDVPDPLGLSNQDSPHVEIDRTENKHWFHSLACETFLMFKSNKPGSVWIPLRYMSWWCRGTIDSPTLDNGQYGPWVLDPNGTDKSNSSELQDHDATDFPTWTHKTPEP